MVQTVTVIVGVTLFNEVGTVETMTGEAMTRVHSFTGQAIGIVQNMTTECATPNRPGG